MLGLIVVAEAPLLPGRDEIEAVVALTVLLVLLHGVTAAPLSAVLRPPCSGDGSERAREARNGRGADHVGSVPPGIKRGGETR